MLRLGVTKKKEKNRHAMRTWRCPQFLRECVRIEEKRKQVSTKSQSKKRMLTNDKCQTQVNFPGGVLLGILGGGVPPGSPNPDLEFLKARFRFLLVRFYLDESANKKFLQKHFEFAHCNFFLIHLELKR